jgi:hypothetical protein
MRKKQVTRQSDVKSDVGLEKRPKSPAPIDSAAVADIAARIASLPPEALAALSALFSGKSRRQ